MIFIGADHRGFKLKEKIKMWLEKRGYGFTDMGAKRLDPYDDYVFYAQMVAQEVVKDKGNRGVLLCGSGVGVDATANKFDGIRASIAKETRQVKAGRTDDDMNVLVIASDYTKEDEAKKMLKTFLETSFDGKPRHKKRLKEIAKIEEEN